MPSPRFQTVPPEHPTTEAYRQPEQEVFVNLLRSYDCLWSEQGKFFARFGVTPQQFNVLKVLASPNEGPGVACQAIAEKLLNRVPDITRLLDRLEQAGLIWRERCCADRRVVRISATRQGKRILEEGRDRRIAVIAESLADLPDAAVADIAAALDAIEQVAGTPNKRSLTI